MAHYSKYQGSQGMARKLEREKISRSGKLRVIRALQNPQHEYLSFLVCRNPVEKLLSVYNFMRYQVLHNKRNMAKSNPPTWQTYFPRSSPPFLFSPVLPHSLSHLFLFSPATQVLYCPDG